MKSFEELVGGSEGLSPEQYARLRRTHELLLEVPAPPDVPRRLRAPGVVRLPSRRRRYVPALIAAALLAASFAAGFAVGREGDADVVRSISMRGVGDGAGASATIDVLARDDAGNYPMNVVVRGLEPNEGSGDWYELWLTEDGRPIASCGRFTVDDGRAGVRLSVPYDLRGYDGWIVTRRGSDEPLLST